MTARKDHPTEKPPVSAWWKSPRTKIVASAIGGILLAALIVWLIFFRPWVSTDDARVDGSIVRVANAGINGPMTRVCVKEGDNVTNGMLVVELDHRTAQAQLGRAQARAALTAAELRRTRSLLNQQGASRQQLERAEADEANAEADLQLARIALERTYLRSPVNGVVIQKLAIEGNILEANQAAVTVIDIDHAWVSANISEKKISRVRTGAKVIVHLDTGGQITGTVSDIRRATASTFALIPSENASGNFIKIVQHIPVKISLNPHPRYSLRVGQSVEIRILAP